MAKDTRKVIHKKRHFSRKNKKTCNKSKPSISSTTRPIRVAILFAGRIKAYTNIESYLLNLKNVYEATVFCSLNKKIKSDYIQTFCNKFGIRDEQLNLELTKTHESEYSQWIMCSNESTADERERRYSQFFHKYRAFQLLESYQTNHKIAFDCVLLFRADVNSSEEFILKPPKENTLYIPEGKDYYGLNDQLAYGNFETMKKYCYGAVHFKDVCDQLGILKFPYSINENIMKKHVENTKCILERFPYNYDLHYSRAEPLPEYDDFE
jgi:hypothetical protein